jgi:hypothetical protein
MAKFKSDLPKWAGIISVFIWFCSFTVAICVSYQQVQHIISKLQTYVPLPIFLDPSNFSWTIY